jgi:branched-chain amino acid transport system substrate-binding protein
MKKITKLVALAAISTMILPVLAGCGSKAPAQEGPIKIAVAAPQTGDYAEYGTGFKNAVNLMAEEWNAKGGVLGRTIEVVVYDDKNNGEEAATIAEKIASDDSISAVIGHFASGVAMAATPKYQETGIVNISPSASHADFTKEGNFIFRNNTVISIESKAAVEIALNTLGKKKIGVLSVKTDWGTNTAGIVKKLITELGGELVDHQEIVDGTVDFSPNISQLSSAGAEVVIVAAMYNTLAPLATQYKAVNKDIQFVGFSNAYSQQLIELAKENAEGIHFPAQFFSGSAKPEVSKFVEAYKAKYGSTPSSLTAQAYDSMGIILTAIQNAKSTDRAKIRDEVEKIEYSGVTGATKFNENRDSVRPFTVVKIEGGKFVEVK